jgi:hypothetical protein
MRHTSSVTSVSWIPSEAVVGGTKVAFEAGFTHYDEPPPPIIEDLEELRTGDRFRFANVLQAWIDVDASGRITDCGYDGGGQMGATTVSVAGLRHRFQAVSLADLRREPFRGADRVTFVQTCGGRTGLPAPRRVRRRPFIQWRAPLVWTTLELTLHADGHADFAMLGASRFPRHWVYDPDGRLALKSGLTDFRDWYRKCFGRSTPWGEEDSPALVTAVETALEQSLSTQLMRGTKPRIKRVAAGTVLARQGEAGTEVYLLLDGVVRVEHDGERLAEYGPGAMLGERSALQDGMRTSTNVAVTACRIAVADASSFERSALEELSLQHRREDALST